MYGTDTFPLALGVDSRGWATLAKLFATGGGGIPSGPLSTIEGYRSEGELFVGKGRETGPFHQSAERLAAGKRLNGLVEIAVGFGVAGEPFPQKGKGKAKPEKVEHSPQGIGGDGKLQDQKPPARAQNPIDILQAGFRLGKVADAEHQGHHIGAGIRQGNGDGVSMAEGDLFLQLVAGDFFPSQADHVVGEIQADDSLYIGVFGQCQGNISRSRGQVDDLKALFGRQMCGELGSPTGVDAEAEDAVDAVVTLGNLVEHFPRFLFFDIES